MGDPLFKNERFFREKGVHIFSSNYALYGDMSQRMMAILGEMAPGQEIYSIDESFLDVSGIASYMPLHDFGVQMRERVKRDTHLTIGEPLRFSWRVFCLSDQAATSRSFSEA
ncbi:hypothetical protein GCM10007905_06300 [Mixta theicola]|nr:hypothetical protein GCM10007905_06300 [Mixta theicola]